MTILGLILIVVGVIIPIQWMWIIGIVLAVVGVALAFSGTHGRVVAGRSHYF
ncbi:hypothetical protein ACQ7HM_06255 [Williamsia sp. MIQD14]|uniref:hypothetical protein n=1 Tax=Williamsia sp. MIQD14 TaxID=3425703 RepID=UPI003DA188F7